MSAPAHRFLLLLGLAAPWTAGAAPERAAEPVEEVVITARRPVVPDFQESYEHHKAELARLKRIYAPDPPPRFSPAERKLRAPELITGTLPGKPTITERLD